MKKILLASLKVTLGFIFFITATLSITMIFATALVLLNAPTILGIIVMIFAFCFSIVFVGMLMSRIKFFNPREDFEKKWDTESTPEFKLDFKKLLKEYNEKHNNDGKD